MWDWSRCGLFSNSLHGSSLAQGSEEFDHFNTAFICGQLTGE